MENGVESFDLLKKQVNDFPEVFMCFSHLRWDFVYQRPQHLLTRMSEDAVVYYIEEPVYDADEAHYAFTKKESNVIVVVPHLPGGMGAEEQNGILKSLLDELLQDMDPSVVAFWYYTPMALKFTRHLRPKIIVFDCMDELSAFKFAPAELKELEQELLSKADVVFTGGASLFEAKKERHNNIHLFPSSIEKDHFGKARMFKQRPDDQSAIPHPRIGFFGVIDERFDTALIRGIAEQRPEWHIILIGPVVKIDPATLPVRPNIHYLGSKPYALLPDYLSGWDAALIPFALNESTRFISPTKTPEYLAAGIPVISTPLMDVIEPYGRLGLVTIAANAAGFVSGIERTFDTDVDYEDWLIRVDNFLGNMSWDDTCSQMKYCIKDAVMRAGSSARVQEKAVN